MPKGIVGSGNGSTPHSKRPKAPSGVTREKRRENIMSRVVVFLRSLNTQSDRVARIMKSKRGELAQAQYELARDLADTIERELQTTVRCDSQRNEIRTEDAHAN